LGMSAFIALSLTAIIFLSRNALIGMFNQDPEVIRVGSEYLLIVSACYLLFAGLFSLNGLLRGAGDTLVPMFITLFSLWVIRIPSAVFLSKHFGETGIWLAVPFGWATGLLLSYIYYRTGRWKTKAVTRVEERNKALVLKESPVVSNQR